MSQQNGVRMIWLLLITMRQEHRCEINGVKPQSEGTVELLFYNHNKEGAFPTVSLFLLIQNVSVKSSRPNF